MDPETINLIPQYPIITGLDDPITIGEVTTSIGQLKNNKSPGCDEIPAEILKVLSGDIAAHMTSCFNEIWDTHMVPQDFQKAIIVNLFKNKGDSADCNNYTGISLLSVAGKVLSRIMVNRLIPVLEKLLPDSQCGFRPGRGTVDLIFTLRQLQEKAIEQNTALHVVFIDLTKAFDTIDRNTLWSIMERLGIPPKFIAVCRSVHTNKFAQVLHNGKLTDSFLTNTGVRHV